jgi:hypothetical protein
MTSNAASAARETSRVAVAESLDLVEIVVVGAFGAFLWSL